MSQESHNKKEKEKKRLKRKKDKQEKKEERKANYKKGKTLEEMFAYVDERGYLTSTAPDQKKKATIKTEDIQISVSRQEAPKAPEGIRKGTVTFFNESKGYGFIKDNQTKENVFVHLNGLMNPIKENDKVTFETEMGRKGLNAVNVKREV